MTTPVPRSHRCLFACGVLLGLVAEQVVLFAVPLLIFQDTKDLSTLGFAFALEWLPGLIAYPFAGILADRDGGARLFSRVAGARAAVLCCAVAALLLWPSWTTATLMASGALLSVLVAPVRMSVEKMVPRLAKGEQLASTQALVQNMELLAMALGPALAMLGAFLLGKVWLLAVAAAVFALAGACWLPLPRAAVSRAGQSARANIEELRLGWSLLAGNKPVLLLGLLNFAINLVLATLLSMNAALVTGVFKAPDSAFALLNTCVGVIGLINLLVIPILLRKFSVQLLGVFGFTLMSLSFLGVGVTPSFTIYAVLYIAALTGDALYNVYNRTQRIRVIPQEHLGKVMGPFYLLNLLSFPLAGLLVGSAATVIGPQNLVAGLAIGLCLVGAVFLPLTMRSFRLALAAQEDVPVGVQA